MEVVYTVLLHLSTMDFSSVLLLVLDILNKEKIGYFLKESVSQCFALSQNQQYRQQYEKYSQNKNMWLSLLRSGSTKCVLYKLFENNLCFYKEKLGMAITLGDHILLMVKSNITGKL